MKTFMLKCFKSDKIPESVSENVKAVMTNFNGLYQVLYYRYLINMSDRLLLMKCPSKGKTTSELLKEQA